MNWEQELEQSASIKKKDACSTPPAKVVIMNAEQDHPCIPTNPTKIYQGACVRWILDKDRDEGGGHRIRRNFGFLHCGELGCDIFIHNTAIKGCTGFRRLHKGEQVQFTLGKNKKGHKATAAWPLQTASATHESIADANPETRA